MAWFTETKVVVAALVVFAIVLLCGYGDSHSGTNDYGAVFSSAVNGVTAVGTVVAIAIMIGLVLKHHFGKK